MDFQILKIKIGIQDCGGVGMFSRGHGVDPVHHLLVERLQVGSDPQISPGEGAVVSPCQYGEKFIQISGLRQLCNLILLQAVVDWDEKRINISRFQVIVFF